MIEATSSYPTSRWKHWPKDDPKIAVAAYVENGGFGATWAAPIASLLTEMYLNGEISKDRKALEDRIIKGDLMDRVKVKK